MRIKVIIEVDTNMTRKAFNAAVLREVALRWEFGHVTPKPVQSVAYLATELADELAADRLEMVGGRTIQETADPNYRRTGRWMK